MSPALPTFRTSRSATVDVLPDKEQDLLPIESAERLFWSTLNSNGQQKDSFTFGPYPDQSIALDPIVCGIVTLEHAKQLFSRFHLTFGRALAYFDPTLCTFDYVRSRSHALLSVMCFIVARSEPGQESLAVALDRHIQHAVLPAILLQRFRSVEIVQTLMMLAAFERPSDSIREDRAWTLLSHSSRIGSELNMQASLHMTGGGLSELDERELRNVQRTWINVWLHEFSLAQHTGRRAILAEQDLFTVCRSWHTHPLACYTDTALVSMVELRTIVKRNRLLYKQLPRGSESFYVEQCKSDLDSWSRVWASSPTTSSMPRLELSSLYVNHALVQLLGLALHNQPTSEWMSSIILDLYNACSAYLDAYPSRLPPEKLLYCYNSMFVAATYEAIVAIRLTKLASRFTFIDPVALRARCHRVWSCLAEVAMLSSSDTPARCYARFLEGVLRPSGPTEHATEPEADPTLFEVNTSIGFDDLEIFAWAGASLAQNDSFDVQVFGLG